MSVLSGCGSRPAAESPPGPSTAAEAPQDPRVTNADRLDGEDLGRLPPETAELRIADFTGTAESLRALKALPQLRLLHIGGAITDAHLREIASLGELRTLNLSRSQVSDAGLKELARLTQLRLLRLSSSAVTDEGMAAIAELRSLRGLHLVGIPITDRGIESLCRMTWLESFYLDGGAASDESLYRLIKAIPELHFHKDQLHLSNDPNADP